MLFLTNGASHGLNKNVQHLIKNELETKSTKHVEHVLNLKPLDLQETRFRVEELPSITQWPQQTYKI